MNLELRVQHLEELVLELRQQVRALQARLDEASSPVSSFDVVAPAESSSATSVPARHSSGSLGLASPQTRVEPAAPLTGWNPSTPSPLTRAEPSDLTAWNPNPSPPSSVRPGAPISATERAAACREIGLFLRRALSGEHRGASGRDRLKLQSRLWLVARDFSGQPCNPVRVCKSFAECAQLTKRSGECGESVFVACRPGKT